MPKSLVFSMDDSPKNLKIKLLEILVAGLFYADRQIINISAVRSSLWIRYYSAGGLKGENVLLWPHFYSILCIGYNIYNFFLN